MGYISKIGLLLYFRSLIFLGVGSIRKCLTRLIDGFLVDFVWILVGTVVIFSVKLNVFGKELLFLIIKVLGVLFFNNWMVEKEGYKI